VGNPCQRARRTPGSRLGSVRTETPAHLVGSRCPVCRERWLLGRQTVCSAKCRAKRWRQTKHQIRRTRDAEIRVLLVTALKKLKEGDP
jgi:hypothetical protein